MLLPSWPDARWKDGSRFVCDDSDGSWNSECTPFILATGASDPASHLQVTTPVPWRVLPLMHVELPPVPPAPSVLLEGLGDVALAAGGQSSALIPVFLVAGVMVADEDSPRAHDLQAGQGRSRGGPILDST